MAGVVPKKSTSGRKQWSIHDGHRSSLKRLRNQLASDGCPESQVVLAKQLLGENSDLESESKENARLGVYWLIKASEQGNTEATELLKRCLETGRGICELNYLDVKSCITMSQDEKLARKAAREMFASLSNGGEYITSDQLQRKMLIIDKGGEIYMNGELNINNYDDNYSDSDEEEWSLKSDNNEKLTEDNLVAAAVDYSHGQLPIVSQNLCFDPDLRALDEIPIIHRPILHPILNFRMLYLKLVRYFSQMNFLNRETHIFGLLLAYILFSSTINNILYFFPILLYFITFIIMIVTTFHMLQIRRNFNDFRLWSGLFICYSGGSLNAEQAEFQYICNNLKPYGYFFGALLANLLIYPIIMEQWIPQSELTIISFCLTFMTLLGFMEMKRSKIIIDFYVLLSFAINVLAKYPYDMDPVVAQGWRFLDVKIPHFTSYIIGNGIEFCINFKVLLYACIPILLVKIASKNNWKGTYNVLIPHCVTLSWLQLTIISAQGATMYGLLRGTLALVGFVLFLPLVGLTTILLPAAALTKWIFNSNFLLSFGLFLIFVVIGLGLCWMCAQSRYKKFTTFIQIFCTFLAAFTLINSIDFINNYGEEKEPSYLSWEIYQRFCHQLMWQEENVAVAQIKCAELDNAHIQWDGYVTDIKIKAVYNKWKTLFSKLPKTIKNQLQCLYGDEIKDDYCENFPEMVKDDCYAFHNTIKYVNECSLEKYNVYKFEIRAKMHSGIWSKSPEVLIIVDDYFKNFTLALKPNDHIWFKGTLFNNELIDSNSILGGSLTHVKLEEIGCLACTNEQLKSIKIEHKMFNVRSIINALILGLKFILNVLLNPVVVLK